MTPNLKLNLSIVIPVYCGEKTISELTMQIKLALGNRDNQEISYEIIFVCDQSPDNSWNMILDLALRHSEVRGILLGTNVGQHNALMAGFSHAKGEIIVTMDDDLQHSPNDIMALITEVRAGKDVVYANFITRKHALWKIAGSCINNIVASHLINKPKNLYLSPFRALKASIRDEILYYRGPYVYIDGLILSVTKNIGSVLVHHYSRYDGKSGYGLYKSISLWLKMATSFSIFPLRLTSLAGMLISLLGFIFAIFLIIQKLTLDRMPIGWSSIIVTILIIGGLQLLAIGMIGEYLGRVLITLNSRPQYVVAARVGVADTIVESNK
jgi:glycosyltransferase involved in cell wall biosynthesis